MGTSRPASLNTTISPGSTGDEVIDRKMASPLYSAGSMLPLRTTTTGDSLPVASMSERQIASAVDTTKPGVETEKEEDKCELALSGYVCACTQERVASKRTEADGLVEEAGGAHALGMVELL